MTNLHSLEIFRERREAEKRVEESAQLLKGDGGDGTSDGMDTVDAKIATAKAEVDTEFAKLRGDLAVQFGEIKTELARKPGTGTTIITAIAIFAAVMGAIAFGGDRFDAGLGMADVRQAQLARDAEQDASVQRIEGKIDQLIAALPAETSHYDAAAETQATNEAN